MTHSTVVLRIYFMKLYGGFLPLILVALSYPSLVQAHSGGTNAEGCHTNSKTGDYHCHGGSAPSRTPQRNNFTPAAPRERTSGFASPPANAAGGGAYRNCSEARAAGAAPVMRGEPGYGQHLDRDGDGIGCEPNRGR